MPKRRPGDAPLYLATASSPAICHAIRTGLLGQVITPNVGHRPEPGALWILDNGCFSDKWSPDRWSATLDRYRHLAGECLWVTVPDVVGDADATFDMWVRWWPAGLRRGYRLAYVAQDGCRYLPTGISAVFLGGSTGWKLGPEARSIVELAKSRRLWVHMGRVNSLQRYRYAASIGCDSVDGTYLTYAPDKHLPRLLAWRRQLGAPRLFDLDR